MTARLCMIGVAAALAFPTTAAAHNVGWPIHKAVCAVTGICRDVPPRPGPQTDCTADRVGDIERIWDERLGAYVEWECRADGKWYRVRIVQRPALPWEPPRFRYVTDWHRACKSIVCTKVGVGHNYPTQWLLGR